MTRTADPTTPPTPDPPAGDPPAGDPPAPPAGLSVADVEATVRKLFTELLGTKPTPPAAPAGDPPAPSSTPADPTTLEALVKKIMGEADRDALLNQLTAEVDELKKRPAAAPARRRAWGSWLVGE